MLKWKSKHIANGLIIIRMKMEHLVLLNSVSFLPCALRKLTDPFNLEATKSWYPHYFNTSEKFDNVGLIPEILYYGVDEISGEERKESLAWYERQKLEPFNNRRLLEP